MLYTILAKRFSRFLVQRGAMCDDDVEVFEYGFESIASLLLNLIVFIIVALIFNTFIVSLVYYLAYIFLRSFSGGYHSKSHLSCFIWSLLIILSFEIIVNILPMSYNAVLTFILAVPSVVINCMFAGIDNINKPLSAEKKHKNKKASILISSTLSIVSCACVLILPEIGGYAIAIMIGVFSASISLLIARTALLMTAKQE